MSIARRIDQLERQADEVKLKTTVKFFDSHDEYKQALQRNEIKEHHICLIDDVPKDD